MLKKILNNIRYLHQLFSYMTPSFSMRPTPLLAAPPLHAKKVLALTLFGEKKYLSEYYLLNETFSNLSLRITFLNIDCEFQYPKRYQFITLSCVFNQVWKSIYQRIGLISESNFNSSIETTSVEYLTAEKIVNELRSKEDLLELQYKKIQIGDLVYDTYLRFKPSKTLDINDRYLLEIMYFAILMCNKALDELPKYSMLISPYVGYIQWGIYPRVAHHLNIECVIIGYANQFLKKLRHDFPIQCKDHDLYSKQLSLKHADIEQAKLCLDNRLKRGIVDSAISYMTVNPFQSTQHFNLKEKVSKKPAAIFFLHSFSDCPHIFRDMLFPDFYEWITQSLDVASQTDFQFFIKPHPADPLADEIVPELKKKYPHFTFLDKSISNLEIAESGMKAIFTIYGTVAHEFPYLGVPAVCAGDNPHINFDFCITAKDKEEYFYYIKNLDKIVLTTGQDEIASFYYQHNLLPSLGRLNEYEYETLLAYQKNFNPKKEWIPPQEIITSLKLRATGVLND